MKYIQKIKGYNLYLKSPPVYVCDSQCKVVMKGCLI